MIQTEYIKTYFIPIDKFQRGFFRFCEFDCVIQKKKEYFFFFHFILKIQREFYQKLNCVVQFQL